MKSKLRRRIEKLRVPILLRMRDVKGPCELVSWWERFVRDIPKDADFADLDRKKQDLILSWEKDISRQESTKDKSTTRQGSCEQ